MLKKLLCKPTNVLQQIILRVGEATTCAKTQGNELLINL